MIKSQDFAAFLQTQGHARRFSAPLAYKDFMDGSYAGAVFLDQILFWYSKGGSKDGWFYKSAKEWNAGCGLSTDSVKKYTKMLVQLGVLETKLYPANGAPTTHFKLDAEKLYAILVEAFANQAEGNRSGPQGRTTISQWLETSSASVNTDKPIWAKPQKENQDKNQQTNPRPFGQNPKSITEASREEAEEDSFFQKEGELENPSSAQPKGNVLPIKEIPEIDVVSKTGNGVMSTGYVEQAKVFDVEQEVVVILPPNATYPVTVKVQNAPDIATLVAESLPVEPVKVKAKPKRAAAKPKTPKSPKEPDAREAAFIAQIEKLDTYIAEDMRTRCGTYRASDPWSVSQVYLLTKVRILKPLWSDVAAINGESFDAAALLKVYKAWIAKHNDPHNLAWLLEWYKAGGPPQYKPNGYGQQPTAVQPAPAPSKPELAFDDPLVKDVAQWVYAKPGYKGKGLYSIQLAMWCALNGKPTQQMSNAEDELAEYWAAHPQDKRIGLTHAT